MFKGQLRHRILWSHVIILAFSIIILFLGWLMVLSFVREGVPILVDPVLGSLASFVLAGTISGGIKKAFDWKVRVEYPEDYEVYYLHKVKLETVWNTLNVLAYPNAEYSQNPILQDTEDKLERLPREQLLGNAVYITGKPGSGKSTVVVRLIDVLRNKLRKHFSGIPSSKHPKLVVINPRTLRSDRVNIDRITEQIVLVVDDFQDFKKEQQTEIIRLIGDFFKGAKEGFVICASRL